MGLGGDVDLAGTQWSGDSPQASPGFSSDPIFLRLAPANMASGRVSPGTPAPPPPLPYTHPQEACFWCSFTA